MSRPRLSAGRAAMPGQAHFSASFSSLRTAGRVHTKPCELGGLQIVDELLRLVGILERADQQARPAFDLGNQGRTRAEQRGLGLANALEFAAHPVGIGSASELNVDARRRSGRARGLGRLLGGGFALYLGVLRSSQTRRLGVFGLGGAALGLGDGIVAGGAAGQHALGRGRAARRALDDRLGRWRRRRKSGQRALDRGEAISDRLRFGWLHLRDPDRLRFG
jgi:hypothetical protein